VILAIDTSSEFASIALLMPDGSTREVLLNSSDGHAHKIFEQIHVLLERESTSLDQVTGFAAASGPGSFTGVRVALAAAKGFAEANRKPLLPVSNLEALAWHGQAPLRAPLIDARRGEIYGALYDAALDPVLPETVGSLQSWLSTLPNDAIEFVATDFGPFGSVLKGPQRLAPRGLATAIAHIAQARILAGRAQDPAAADANYVRRSDAELNF